MSGITEEERRAWDQDKADAMARYCTLSSSIRRIEFWAEQDADNLLAERHKRIGGVNG